jgi:catechol 2,3-dioxygenase-like lactoylglutathione lyase family enzyme
MSVALDHTIVAAKDRWASARFLAGILGLEAGPEWAHFVPVRTHNGVTLDFVDSDEVRTRHFAFLVDEADFDAGLARIREAGAAFHAEFDGAGPGQINRHYGGRGVYFRGPEGHLFELITRPYGPTPER